MRTCSECKQPMIEGYCIDGGADYYCTDECLHKHISPEEWDDMYEEEGESYWTEWHDEEDEDEVESDSVNCPYCQTPYELDEGMAEDGVTCNTCKKGFYYTSHTVYTVRKAD